MKKIIATLLMLGVAAVANAGTNPSNTVVGSSHDLSDPAGTVAGSNQICVFCHTPHNANAASAAPLWSHALSTATYTPYNNPDFSTITAGQPGSISKACLSCHDGSVALGYVANGAFTSDGTAPNNLSNTAHGARDSAGLQIAIGDAMNIGGSGDLSTTHPVGITYPGANTAFNDVASNTNVKLFKEGGGSANQVECASCHEPHNQGAKEPRYFLRSTNAGSALCLQCHIK